RVRASIRGIGLHNTYIPNTTRQMFGYFAGVRDWETIAWNELVAAFERLPPTGPSIVNDVQTMASTASDFVSLSPGPTGRVLRERRDLDDVSFHPGPRRGHPPLHAARVSAFHKSGSIDFRHEHALTLMGRRVHPRSPLGLRPLGIQVLRNIFAWIKDAFGTCH